MKQFIYFLSLIALLTTSCGGEDDACEPLVDLGVVEPTDKTLNFLPSAYLNRDNFLLENPNGDRILFTQEKPDEVEVIDGRETLSCENEPGESVYSFGTENRTIFYSTDDPDAPIQAIEIQLQVTHLLTNGNATPDLVDVIRIRAYRQNDFGIFDRFLGLQSDDRESGRKEQFGSIEIIHDPQSVEINGEQFENAYFYEGVEIIFFQPGDGIIAIRDYNDVYWKRVR